MKQITIFLLIIFVNLSISVTAQNEKTAIIKDVNGIVFFKFLENGEFHCMLKSSILIDTILFDFLPVRNSNTNIIKQNLDLESKIGKANSFVDSSTFMTFKCFHANDSIDFKRLRCDSFLDIYRSYNILDPLIFDLDYSKSSVQKINSDCIYKSQANDTVYIIFGFKGSVVMYYNIELGMQVDERIRVNENGTKDFDDSHSTCPFEIYNSTLVVLNKVDEIYTISDSLIGTLKLKKLEVDGLKVFLYE